MKLWTLDGTTILSTSGALVRQLATHDEARSTLYRLNAYAAVEAAAVAVDDTDASPEQLAMAIDEALDAAEALIVDNDATTLPGWAQQVVSLALAAASVADELLESMNIVDPDDLETSAFDFAKFKLGDRLKMGKNGVAMPDGSFPIPDAEHLPAAIKNAKTPAHKAHIKKRAKALGKNHMIPSDWSN
jgi:hypothetical protein